MAASVGVGSFVGEFFAGRSLTRTRTRAGQHGQLSSALGSGSSPKLEDVRYFFPIMAMGSSAY